jgi:hypothetical protein
VQLWLVKPHPSIHSVLIVRSAHCSPPHDPAAYFLTSSLLRGRSDRPDLDLRQPPSPSAPFTTLPTVHCARPVGQSRYGISSRNAPAVLVGVAAWILSQRGSHQVGGAGEALVVQRRQALPRRVPVSRLWDVSRGVVRQ